MDDIWKDVVEYEDNYQVSNKGEIRSKDRIDASGHRRKSIVLKLNKLRAGYLSVELYKDGVGIRYTVHRIVAKAFLPCDENMTDVNHKNGVKDDNRAENLEWCTKSENMIHKFRVLKVPPNKPNIGLVGSRNYHAVKIVQMTEDGNTVRVFGSISDAKRELGVSISKVSEAINGRIKKYRGYMWRKYSEVFSA